MPLHTADEPTLAEARVVHALVDQLLDRFATMDGRVPEIAEHLRQIAAHVEETATDCECSDIWRHTKSVQTGLLPGRMNEVRVTDPRDLARPRY